MSTTMDQIHNIRNMFYQQDMSIAEIASETGLNWKTVKKYVDMDNFNVPLPIPAANQTHVSKLDIYKPLIDTWLQADKFAPRKQRHTAKRVFTRLQKETDNFNCSYRLVAQYVSLKKKEMHLNKKDGSIPLEHRPGEAQADFGYADFYENGKHYHNAKYLVLSFPYSNGGFLQLNYGENLECLLEGLTAIFEHIGGVPTEIWFDNTRTIVTDIIKGGGRKVCDRFERFCEHYRFKPVFMNPASGWEKGNVENKVGYLRRNELVPLPQFKSLSEENKYLLSQCETDMHREHYDDDSGRFISELFEEDKMKLISLPSIPFDTSLYTDAMTDKYGKFTLDSGKHRYSASPGFAETFVNLKITSQKVTVMDADMKTIVIHKRLYGEEHERMDWLPYLSYIARRPRSLRNSGIYGMMPETMKDYLDNCENCDRGRVLKILAELTERTGFDSAVHTVDEAIKYNATDPDSLENLYRRTYTDVPILPPLNTDDGLPSQKVIPLRNDLTALDAVLKKGGAFSCG